MRTRKKPVVPARLAKVQKRFESWRSRSRPRTRIPEELWTAAVGLAHEIGEHRTAKALRLDFYTLKKRIKASFSARKDALEALPQFVELLPAGIQPCECTVELEDANGTKMRIVFKGASPIA
jgi:hypothetical protein